MAATLTTFGTNITAPVNFVLMRRLLSAARAKLPYFNGTLPGDLQKAQGSASVKWRRIENLTTQYVAPSALVEPSATASAFLGRSAVQPAITDVNVAMAKYGQAILITEEVDLFNVNSNTVALMDTLGADAGLNLNLLMRDVIVSGASGGGIISTAISANGSRASTYSSAGTAISLNDIKYCVNRLNRQSAMKFFANGYGSTNVGTSPIRESYLGVCHVDVEDDIRALSGFVPVEQYGGYTEIYPFEFGTVGGVRFCSTEIAPVITGGSTQDQTGMRGASTTVHDVYRTFIWGKEAIGSVGLGNMHATSSYEMYDPKTPPAVDIIVHQPGSSGIYDMFNEVGSIAWKSWFAGKVLNANWLTMINSLSTQP